MKIGDCYAARKGVARRRDDYTSVAIEASRSAAALRVSVRLQKAKRTYLRGGPPVTWNDEPGTVATPTSLASQCEQLKQRSSTHRRHGNGAFGSGEPQPRTLPARHRQGRDFSAAKPLAPDANCFIEKCLLIGSGRARINRGRSKFAGRRRVRLGKDVRWDQFVEYIPRNGFEVIKQPFTFTGSELVPPAQNMVLPPRPEGRKAIPKAFVNAGSRGHRVPRVMSVPTGHNSPRMVLKQAGEGRTYFHNMAIIHCQVDSYGPLNMVNPKTRSRV